MPPSRRILVAGLIAGTLFVPQIARADALDGEWCKDARSLTIQGPNILTPGGTQMTGEYSRHQFRYVIPQGEPQQGDTVEMSQRNDEEMDLRIVPAAVGSAPGAWERWRRCKVTS